MEIITNEKLNFTKILGTMLSSGNSGDQGSLHGSSIVQYGQDGSVVNYVPGNELNRSFRIVSNG